MEAYLLHVVMSTWNRPFELVSFRRLKRTALNELQPALKSFSKQS